MNGQQFLNEIKDYLSSSSFYDKNMMMKIFEELSSLITVLLQIIIKFTMLLVYIIVLIIKGIYMISPHVYAVFNDLREHHRTKMSTIDMLIELLIVLTVFLIFQYRSQLQITWNKLQHEVAQKSSIAASTAPYIVFFGVSLLISIFGVRYLEPFSSEKALPLFTLVTPACATLYTIASSGVLSSLSENNNNNSSNNNSNSRIKISEHHVEEILRHLKIWLVLGAYHTAATTFGALPMMWLIRLTGIWGDNPVNIIRTAVLVMAIWIQLSAEYADVAYGTADRAVENMAHKVPVPLSITPTSYRRLRSKSKSSLGGGNSRRNSSSNVSSSGSNVNRDKTRQNIFEEEEKEENDTNVAESLMAAMAFTFTPVKAALQAGGWVSRDTSDETWLTAVMQDTLVLLLTLFSLTMPRPFDTIGVLAICFTVPVLKTAEVLAIAVGLELERKELLESIAESASTTTTISSSTTTLSSSSIKTNNNNAVNTDTMSDGSTTNIFSNMISFLSPGVGMFTSRKSNRSQESKVDTAAALARTRSKLVATQGVSWAAYWCSWAFIWASNVYYNKCLWSSIIMIIAMYLQHSYFRGGVQVLSECLKLASQLGIDSYIALVMKVFHQSPLSYILGTTNNGVNIGDDLEDTDNDSLEIKYSTPSPFGKHRESMSTSGHSHSHSHSHSNNISHSHSSMRSRSRSRSRTRKQSTPDIDIDEDQNEDGEEDDEHEEVEEGDVSKGRTSRYENANNPFRALNTDSDGVDGVDGDDGDDAQKEKEKVMDSEVQLWLEQEQEQEQEQGRGLRRGRRSTATTTTTTTTTTAIAKTNVRARSRSRGRRVSM